MDFNEIIANIERELAELNRINETLREENTLLKNGMNISTEGSHSSLSIEHAFYDAMHAGRKGQARNNAYRVLMEYNCVFLADINEKILAKMYREADRFGIPSLAFIVVVLKHYSINIEIPFNALSINRELFERKIEFTERCVVFYE